MSQIYKTARGKVVDFAKIRLANENVIAVGNMSVNARGDIVKPNGEVELNKNAVMDKIYAVEDGYSPNDPSRRNLMSQSESNAKDLHDLAGALIPPPSNSIEPTEEDRPAIPQTRGALANSVAKTVAVTQKPLPSPAEQKKSQGPSRI